MNTEEKLAELRRHLARYAPACGYPAVPLGHEAADHVLGGGLKTGALHEVFAQGWGGGGFATLLALRLAATAAGGRGAPLFWIRSDYAALEYGAVAPHGLAALGGDGRQLVMVRTSHTGEALAAAADIVACPHVGCVLLEIEGAPRILDLTASRRLALAAQENGVGVIVLREGAHETASAAHTRWRARAAPSHAKDDDWGNPRFAVELVRHRAGGLGMFLMGWDSHNGCFNTADHGAVATASLHRPADPARQQRRA